MGASTTHQGKLLNCTGSEKLSPSRPCCTPSLKGDSISALRAILHPVENGRKGTGMFCWKLVQMMIGWVVPLPNNSHHQDFTFFVGDSYKPSFATVTGRGDNPNDWYFWLIYNPLKKYGCCAYWAVFSPDPHSVPSAFVSVRLRQPNLRLQRHQNT